MEKSSFDIAVLGAGCSSFQLLHQLSQQPQWLHQKVALFSEGIPQQRSWCFWSKEQHPLQHLVTKSWSKIIFKGKGFSKIENVEPYQYHYIAGEDFFHYFHNDFLLEHENITTISNSVTAIKESQAGFEVLSSDNKCETKNVFSSLPPVWENISARFWLKQHFVGWFIKTEQPVFDDTALTLMDFSIPQQADTRFVYILPFSKTEALVEMTVFSPTVYPESVYEEVLTAYMNQHFPNIHYDIQNTEKGVIPMTDATFSRYGSAGEILLGTSAGTVKATTGYAFKRITKDSQQLAKDFSQNTKYSWHHTKGRFRFYDRLLLGIISDEPLRGSVIFETLFKKIPMSTIFRFLDEETTLLEEIRLFSQLPFFPFLKQIYKQWKW